MSNAAFPLALIPLCLLAPVAAQAQHAHVNAGALATTPGSPLNFANGARFSADSGYAVPLKLATNGPYAGHHYGSITFTALPSTEFNGGPTPGHALPGAHLELRVLSVSGPEGGRFGFWETPGDELDGTELTFSVPVGETAGTRQFPLSENDGGAGDDPYGHYHGRFFSATRPGLYRVGFQAFDTSGNGPGGGPLHAPSEILPMYFQAGITIASIRLTETGVEVSFVTQSGKNHFIDASENLADPAAWKPVAGPLVGDGKLLTVANLPASAATGYLRLRVE